MASRGALNQPVFVDFKEGHSGAFGSLSVSQRHPLVQVTFPYSINYDHVLTKRTGNGTIYQENCMAVTRTAAANSGATLTTHGLVNFRAGQGLAIRFTALFSTAAAASRSEVGVGDAADGFFFGYNGTAFGVMRRQAGVENWTAQTVWSHDKMDGDGPSGEVLDKQKGNVYQIQTQGSDFGAIRYFAQTATGGDFQMVHMEKYGNKNIRPSVDNPSLPLRVRASNGTNTSFVSVKCSYLAGFREGANEIEGESYSANNFTSAAANTTKNILTIRNNAQFNSKTNRTIAFIRLVSAACEGTKPARFQVIEDAILGTSATFSQISANRSIMSKSTNFVTVTGGRSLMEFSLPKSGSDRLLFTESTPVVLHPGETCTVTARSTGAVEADVSLTWVEWL